MYVELLLEMSTFFRIGFVGRAVLGSTTADELTFRFSGRGGEVILLKVMICEFKMKTGKGEMAIKAFRVLMIFVISNNHFCAANLEKQYSTEDKNYLHMSNL